MFKLSSNDISNLDRLIAQLIECKPLTEIEACNLCEKVDKFK